VTPRRIVVGVDGSPCSLAAVKWAADLASATGAEILAVHALGLLDRLEPGDRPVPAEAHLEEIEDRFENRWCAGLSALPHHTEMRYGPPGRVILEVAAETDADLVVVGSRGTGNSPDLVLGSTSSEIARHSQRAVLIVPTAVS
jgi:nucleotide-binding universal stress UspA family protein